MIKRRITKPSAYTLEQAAKLKPKQEQQEAQSPLAFQVMKLGEKCGYREIEVNSALVIGSGVWFWRAYADKAISKRIAQIERVIMLKELEETMEDKA